MNSLIIFDNNAYLYPTIGAAVFFLLICIYAMTAQARGAVKSGIKYLMMAFVLELFSIWYCHYMEELGEVVSGEILMFFALIIRLVILTFCVMSATCIMLNGNWVGLFSGITFALGLVAIVYSTILSPNGNLVNTFYGIFSTIGYAYLASAMFSKCFRRNNIGYVVSFLVLASIAFVLATSVSMETIFGLQLWFSGIVGYIGMGVGILMILVDVKSDEIDANMQKLHKYDLRMKEIIKSSPFPIMISKLSDDTILSANDNFLSMFGIKERDLDVFRFKDFFVRPENRQELTVQLERNRIVKDFEIEVKKPNGIDSFWLSTSANVIDYDYDIALYAAFQEITDRKKREEVLKNQATRDPLTTLYNRRYFEEEVNRRINSQPASRFCVFMIDADHFKSVNDTYGHKVGDKVLVALSSTAQKAMRDKDIIARYGGEEFVVYLGDCEGAEAKARADSLREAISQLVITADDGTTFGFTVSIGISSSLNSRNLGELIKFSDDALYEAKETGRNRCVLYNPNKINKQEKTQEQKQEQPASSPAQETKPVVHQSQSPLQSPRDNDPFGNPNKPNGGVR